MAASEACPYCGSKADKPLIEPFQDARIYACPDCKQAWGVIGNWEALERYAESVSLDDS